MRMFIAAVAFVSQLEAQPADSITAAQRARDVVMRHMNAIGGVEAFSAIQSTHMVMNIRLPVGVDMRSEMWLTKPNLAYMHARDQFTSAEAGFDGKVYWTISEEEGARILNRPPDLLNAAVFDPFAALAMYEVKYMGTRNRGGKKMEVLQMTAGDGQLYTQYFDSESGLFARLEVGDPSAPASTMRFEKYRKFGNLLYATVITTKMADFNESVARITSVDHKPIDPKRYELPKAIRDLAARKP